MSEGLAELAEAFAAAEAELGMSDPSDEATALTVVPSEAEAGDEHAEGVQAEQPEIADTAETADESEAEAEENPLQDLIDQLAEEGEPTDEESAEDPVDVFLASEDFWSTQVELATADGPVTLSLQELAESGLRQADYTKKTQELASLRKQTEDAQAFYDEFMGDPQGFAQTLAVRAGLIEEGAAPVKQMEVGKIPTPDELQAQIDQMVEERIQSDPRFVQAQVAAARQAVDAEFARIEQSRGITLDPAVRTGIVQEAARNGTANLELVLDAQLARLDQRQNRAAERKNAAPSRPSRPTDALNQKEAEKVPESIEEAWSMALAEQQAS